jgi:hypothetical protein
MQANAEKEKQQTGKSIGPRQTHFNHWWKYWRARIEMLDKVDQISRYIACGQVTKRPSLSLLVLTFGPMLR